MRGRQWNKNTYKNTKTLKIINQEKEKQMIHVDDPLAVRWTADEYVVLHDCRTLNDVVGRACVMICRGIAS